MLTYADACRGGSSSKGSSRQGCCGCEGALACCTCLTASLLRTLKCLLPCVLALFAHARMAKVSIQFYHNCTKSVVQQQNEFCRCIVPNFINESFISIPTIISIPFSQCLVNNWLLRMPRCVLELALLLFLFGGFVMLFHCSIPNTRARHTIMASKRI